MKKIKEILIKLKQEIMKSDFERFVGEAKSIEEAEERMRRYIDGTRGRHYR